MSKGFFIVIAKKGVKSVIGKSVVWEADLIDPISGWSKTKAENIQDNIDHQKRQYDERIALNQQVPALVGMNGGPMASGQTVRFVTVG